MPVVKAAFAAGDLAESALRLLADAWNEPVEPVPGKKRRKPKVAVTTMAHDLVDESGGGTIETNHDRLVVRRTGTA